MRKPRRTPTPTPENPDDGKAIEKKNGDEKQEARHDHVPANTKRRKGAHRQLPKMPKMPKGGSR